MNIERKTPPTFEPQLWFEPMASNSFAYDTRQLIQDISKL